MLTRSAGLVRKFSRIEATRKVLLLESVRAVARASAAVRLLPFRRAIRSGTVPVQKGSQRFSAEECVWAVEAAARYLPWRNVCIQKGIAAQRLLRRHGHDAKLHYGARHHPQTGKLEAHVWVTVRGKVIIGGDQAGDFAEVASYP